MPEAVITKSKSIVVDSVGTNDYGDLTFTDKEGTEYRISAKRIQFFTETIVPNMAVQLNYAKSNYAGVIKEYVYSAVQVKDKLPPPIKPIEGAAKQKPTMPEDDTKIRSVAMAYSKDLVVAKIIELKDIVVYANKFVDYILNKEVKPSRLVEEAKKLGAVKEGDD